jgi:hypothetical protein
MYVASDVSLGAKLFVINDSSLNGNLSVGGDLSLNSNLYVVKRALFSSDVSINGNVKLGSGLNSVAINKDISAGYALDVSGLAIFRNTMYVASDLSVNANLFVNRDSSFNGNLMVGGDLSLNSNLYVVKRALFSSDVSINGNVRMGSGSRTVAINKDISAGYALDVSGLVILRNTMYVASDVSLGAKLFVINDSSLNGNLIVGGDLSLNSNLYVVKRALFSSDVSMLGNLDVGSGSSCLAINKDISAGYALDVSGLAIFRNTMYVASDVSLGAKLFVINDSSLNGNLIVGGDLSLNSNLYVVKRALFSSDVSINGNVRMGSGSRLVAINKDISSSFALDVSGATMIRNTLYTGSIDTDISSGQIYLYDSLRHGTGNLFINNNSSSSASTRIGGGSIFIGGSGVTYLRSAPTQPLQIGTNITPGGTVILGTAASKILLLGDASFNGNVKLGSGLNSVSINKDVSAGYALDVSGLAIFRNTMYVVSDVSLGANLFVNRDSSFNGNLLVGGDLSLNSNLYVVKRSVFTLDVSMLGNLDIGTGSNSVAINKDISSSFALDVSGATKFRGPMDVAGVFTVNGAPVTGSGGLTGNVQVGTNSGFVTIDKPYFFADPSLMVFYNFDTSINVGSGVQNIAKPGTYDGSFNVTAGSTTGMIDTTVFNNGKQNNTSLASFRNDPTINNFGIRIGTGTVPVSSTMTFSFWLYKKSRPAFLGGDWDRVFHFTDSTSQFANENNTIALDISAGGNIFPVITKGGGTPVSLITPSLPIVSYDLCTSAWNHIVWTINGTKSIIYINGSNVQTDTLSENITLNTSTQRNRGTIAYSYTTATGATRDFSGNLDDFRYYRDKVLSYSEIYQLYNNNFYTFDICGGFLANGSSVIYEDSGSVATANRGTLTLLHGDASGSSSIMFKSINDPLEYAYIEYDENGTGSTGYHYGLLTIGIENDGGSGSYTQQADRVSLFPSGGTGFVGVNTKTPLYSLDVSGTLNTNADASINGVLIGRGRGNGDSNTVFGYNALISNIDGFTNVAVGWNALSRNIDGFNNVAVGSRALRYNTSGTNNTAVGNNTLSENITGINNTAVGINALTGNIDGIDNTSVGSFVMFQNTTGSNNTAVGMNALNSNTTGNSNIATGKNALYANTTGSNNTSVGSFAMQTNIAGSNNNNNTAIGDNAGNNSTNVGDNNTFLGASTSMSGTFTNSTAVGYNAQITASNQVQLGNGCTAQATSFNATSDYREKDNVMELDETFNVDVLRPVVYDFKPLGKKHVGFIAHEVQEFYPFLVSGEKDGKETQSLNYNGLIGILTKEIKDLKKKVREQSAKALEQEAKALEQSAKALEQSAKALAKALEQEARIQALEKFILNK